MKFCIETFKKFQQKNSLFCNDNDFFLSFFKNNEHISYERRLAKKTQKSKRKSKQRNMSGTGRP